MAKVHFKTEDGFKAKAGIAILYGTLEGEDDPIIADAKFGELEPWQVIGLLQVTLDQMRRDFADPFGAALADTDE